MSKIVSFDSLSQEKKADYRNKIIGVYRKRAEQSEFRTINDIENLDRYMELATV